MIMGEWDGSDDDLPDLSMYEDMVLVLSGYMESGKVVVRGRRKRK